MKLSKQQSEPNKKQTLLEEIAAGSHLFPKSISASELNRALDEEKNIDLVDVRTHTEHRIMRLKGSRLIPLPELVERASELNNGAGQTSNRILVVYCRSGVRSRKACSILRQCGFVDVRNLTGGILAWYREFEEKMIESDAAMETF
jgi:rhodanese-related sulfurtransferase